MVQWRVCRLCAPLPPFVWPSYQPSPPFWLWVGSALPWARPPTPRPCRPHRRRHQPGQGTPRPAHPPEAQAGGADLVIFELDTPGGLLDSTRTSSPSSWSPPRPSSFTSPPPGPTPVPPAPSIAAAAHFAVMAPGTNIGAATPISGSGEDLPETLASKVTNDPRPSSAASPRTGPQPRPSWKTPSASPLPTPPGKP